MEIGATTAFNELNSRENYWSGHFMAWGAMLWFFQVSWR